MKNTTKVKRVVLGEGVPFFQLHNSEGQAFSVGLTKDGIKDFFNGETTAYISLNKIKANKIRLIAEILP